MEVPSEKDMMDRFNFCSECVSRARGCAQSAPPPRIEPVMGYSPVTSSLTVPQTQMDGYVLDPETPYHHHISSYSVYDYITVRTPIYFTKTSPAFRAKNPTQKSKTLLVFIHIPSTKQRQRRDEESDERLDTDTAHPFHNDNRLVVDDRRRNLR
jgi:hypothetical protein